MLQDEIREIQEVMIPVRIRMRNPEEIMTIDPVSVPATWIDSLAFNGDGFSVTVTLDRDILFPAGSTVRVEFGKVKSSEGDVIPPFDPPYISNAKKG